jgi:molybdate transport system regulatory protein
LCSRKHNVKSTSQKTQQALNLSSQTPLNETINMPILSYETKLWMVNEKGESVFGNGLAELIEEIDSHHSILEAANHLEMSYRYALHRITLAEERLGEMLVIRIRGGARGGGSSQVTDFGRDLIKRYRNAQVELSRVLEKVP